MPTISVLDAAGAAQNLEKPNGNGQATMANSRPVVIASDQVLPLPTGAATEATLAAQSAKLPATLGIKTAVGSLSIAPASDAVFAVTMGAVPVGAATEATLAAQSAKLPATLGIKTAVGSLSIAPASDAAFVLGAGSAIAGKVGIDQTTPGTTNAVVPLGNIAALATDSGNGVKISGKASNAGLSAASTGQRQDVWLGLSGQITAGIGINQSVANISAGSSIVVMPLTPGAGGTGPAGVLPYVYNATSGQSPNPGDANAATSRSATGGNSWAYAGASGGVTGTADTPLVAAAGVGVRNFIHSLQLKNTSAVASEVVLKDGASTVLWRGQVSAAMTVADTYSFDPPLRTTANTALNIAMITTATATIVSGQGSQGS